MALLRKGIRPTDAIPTSSMADIAFLLLIFFLITTVFPKDRGLALVLPIDAPAPVPAANVLHLLVQEDGMVEVRHGASPASRLVDADEVGPIWRDAVAANPRLIAAVKTSAGAAYGHMVDVLDQLHVAGSRRISLQLLEEAGR